MKFDALYVSSVVFSSGEFRTAIFISKKQNTFQRVQRKTSIW